MGDECRKEETSQTMKREQREGEDVKIEGGINGEKRDLQMTDADTM